MAQGHLLWLAWSHCSCKLATSRFCFLDKGYVEFHLSGIELNRSSFSGERCPAVGVFDDLRLSSMTSVLLSQIFSSHNSLSFWYFRDLITLGLLLVLLSSHCDVFGQVNHFYRHGSYKHRPRRAGMSARSPVMMQVRGQSAYHSTAVREYGIRQR